jgi:hypothetical protein
MADSGVERKLSKILRMVGQRCLAIPARSANQLPDHSHLDVYVIDEEVREVLIHNGRVQIYRALDPAMGAPRFSPR